MKRIQLLTGFGAAAGASLFFYTQTPNVKNPKHFANKKETLCLGTSSLRKRQEYDVAIVGGGILGCSVGFHLAKLNRKVALIERGTIGCEASSLAAGTLCHHGYEVKEPSWYDYLSSKSRIVFNELESKYGIDLDLAVNGTLTIASNAAEKAYLHEEFKELKAKGSNVTFLSSYEEVTEIEPFVKGGQAIAGLLQPLGGHVDPSKATHGLCEAAEIEGAKIFEGRRVTCIRQIDDESGYRYEVVTSNGDCFFARHVVISTGCHDNQLMENSFGVSVPVVPVKGQIWVTNERPANSMNTVIYNVGCEMAWNEIVSNESPTETNIPRNVNISSKMNGGKRMFHHVYGRQTADGNLLFGGDRIAVFDGHLDYEVDEKLVDENYEYIKKILPSVGDMDGSYCCYMPFSTVKDGKPLLGELTKVGLEGIWLAAGFGPSGITVGPEAGKLLAEKIARNDLTIYSRGNFPTSSNQDSIRVMKELDPNRAITIRKHKYENSPL